MRRKWAEGCSRVSSWSILKWLPQLISHFKRCADDKSAKDVENVRLVEVSACCRVWMERRVRMLLLHIPACSMLQMLLYGINLQIVHAQCMCVCVCVCVCVRARVFRQSVLQVLLQLNKDYPQAIYMAVRVLREEIPDLWKKLMEASGVHTQNSKLEQFCCAIRHLQHP